MHVLIATDKFKDCLSARAGCEIIADELLRLHPDYSLHLCPLSDGGEGFTDSLTTGLGGVLAGEQVADPLGKPMQAAFGIVPLHSIPPAARQRLQLPAHLSAAARIGVVEMAVTSGLQLLPHTERNPWLTHTTGTGQLLSAAQMAGVEAIVLGIGGSATNDLGLGALRALGYRFFDTQGQAVHHPCPANWHKIARIEGTLPAHLPPLRIACDVVNPLLGPEGAVAVYAEQKGLLRSDLPRLEKATERMARMLCEHHGRDFDTLANHPGTGAAGGIAFSLMCAADKERVRLVSGFDLVADWLQLHEHLTAADIVITGEGSFDASSLSGKAPWALASAALELGKAVHVFAGKISATTAPSELHQHTITPQGMPLQEALAKAPQLLRKAVAAVFGQ